MSTPQFSFRPTSTPVAANLRDEILANPGFGQYFTDHMSHIRWTSAAGWHAAEVRPYGALTIDPACPVLHYAQEIFEGLKAYRHADGSIWSFRPERNAARFRNSARRLALPELDDQNFIESIRALVTRDAAWVPTPKDENEEVSLYIRPFMIANGRFLGVKPASEVDYYVIASPAASYFKGAGQPISIWLSSHYNRAAPGGTGAAKCGGNYAASLIAQQEALDNDCEQVVFLDAAENRWVEELGGMNLFFVYSDGRLVTPAVSGTILEGVTRDSILTLARDMDLAVEERPVSIDEWREGVNSGKISEVFACGTAAVITTVGALVTEAGTIGDPECHNGRVATQLRQTLLDIQYGRAEDRYGWLQPLVSA